MSLNIINKCLIALSEEPVQAVNSTPHSQLINWSIDYYYKILLSRYGWSFNLNFATLSQNSHNVNPNYKYSFALPSDFLKIYKLFYKSNYIDKNNYINDYKIINTNLFCNDQNIVLEYSTNNFNIDQTPETFKMCLSYFITKDLGLTMLKNIQISQICEKKYNEWFDLAVNEDVSNSGYTEDFFNNGLYL